MEDLDEAEHFQFSFSLGPQDAELFKSEFIWRRWSPNAVFNMAFTLLASLAFYWCARWIFPNLATFPYIEAVAALPVFALLVWTLGRTARVALRAEGHVGTGPIGMRTTINGLELHLETGVRSVSWSEMKELLITPLMIYVLLADRKVFQLPKRVFEDESDALVFASVVAKYAKL
jgi:MFS superfamily sulfate permease-like transporter